MVTSNLTRAVPFLYLAFVTSFFVFVDGILVNRTIDDEQGDSVTGVKPMYSGIGWSLGSSCATCHIQAGLVDVSKTFDNTWHDMTYDPRTGEPVQVITATFSGVAVYVFNLIANTIRGTFTSTNLSFTLDGEPAGFYVHVPDPSRTDILYNVPVFSNTSLANGPHTIEIRPTGPNLSLILFDYITYTADDDVIASAASTSSFSALTTSPTESPALPHAASQASGPSTVGAIVGGVGGGVALVLIVAAILFFLFRRHRRQHDGVVPMGSTESIANNDSTLRDTSMAERRAAPSLAESPPDYYASEVDIHFGGVEPPLPSDTLSRPASSTATEDSRRYAELADRIRMLENRIARPLPTPFLETTKGSSASQASGARSEEGIRLAQELVTLRSEVAEARTLQPNKREHSSEIVRTYGA